MFRYLMVLCINLMLAAPVAASELQVFPGPWSAVSEADLAVHPMTEEAYTESWFFMVQGEDDLWLFIHYGISNMQPLSDFDGAMETTVIHDGKVTFVKDNIKKKHVTYAEGKVDLTIGSNSLKKVGDAYAVKVSQKGIKLELNVKPLVEGTKPGRSIYPDKEFYELHIAGPKTGVDGSLVLNGKTLAVKGVGYFDHSVQNYPAHKMADRLYSFRGYDAASGVNFLSFMTPSDLGGAAMPTLVLMKDGKIIARATAVSMTGSENLADKDNDYSYPSVWTFEASEGDAPVRGTIKLAKRVQMQNAADDFNFFERTLIKAFVANPMLYRHEGTFEFAVGEQKVAGEGIAEVVILRQ